ncbi:MAG: alpha-L-fucosidase [Bacteroides sp.]
MMYIAKKSLSFLLLGMGLWSCQQGNVNAPEPIGPLPSEHQLTWHQMETYAFIHFGLNTFVDKEWGYGDTPAEVFNPSNLDCEQWVRTIKAAGMTGVILTAKHHDGFCLWQTDLTEYSIRNTPYKQGKGDLVAELRAACDKYGLKMGLYLSPWDRNTPLYGTPAYVDYYHQQIEELTTRYGELFEFWLDGANGGDGYYGGARETRQIDRHTYYNFPEVFAHILRNQPQAIIFSDGGPGCRWVGNERGFASATNWAFLRSEEVYPGYDRSETLPVGHPDGTAWIPAECDVSVRPGWFYHESEDERVKSPEQLVDLYYRSVGRNGNLILNFPIDKSGHVHPIDSTNVVEARHIIEKELANNLLKGVVCSASDTRGKGYGAEALTDGQNNTYWATPDNVTTATLTFTLPQAQRINRLLLQEYIALGQRVQEFSIAYKQNGEWLPIDAGEETTTIGYKRILRFPTVETDALRIQILQSRACPCLSNIEAYYAGESAVNGPTENREEFKSLPFTLTEQADRFILELEQPRQVRSFYYQPPTDGEGLITHYELYAGDTAETATQRVKEGEFSNIVNNPITQILRFAPVKAKVWVLKVTKTAKANETPKAQRFGLQ